MKRNSILFMISGMIGGFLLSLSFNDLYNRLTKLDLGNIVDYEHNEEETENG